MPVETKLLDSGAVLVTVSGRLVVGKEELQLQSLTSSLLGEGKRKFVFDIAAVDYADSSGIGALVACLTEIRQAGGELRIAGANPRMRRLFQVTGVGTLMSLYPTAAAATE